MKGALIILGAMIGGLSAKLGGSILGGLAGLIIEEALRTRR